MDPTGAWYVVTKDGGLPLYTGGRKPLSESRANELAADANVKADAMGASVSFVVVPANAYIQEASHAA